MSEIIPGFQCRQSFDEFDALAEACSGYDTDFRQLSPAEGPCWLEQFVTPHMLYLRVRLSNHFHQLGASPPGYRTFGLLANNTQHFRWCGEAISSSTLLLMPESGEFESVSLPGFEMYNLSLSNELLEQVANAEFNSTVDALLGKERRLCPQGGEQLAEMRALLSRFSQAIAENLQYRPGDESVWRLAQLALSCMADEAAFSPRAPRSKRLATLSASLGIIEEIGPGRLPVSSLARRSGVSRRTLEHAFQDGLGVSPAAYLKARRLRDLHRDLLLADRRTASVAQIVANLGFAHPGQLAADYRRLFGELPSATLSR